MRYQTRLLLAVLSMATEALSAGEPPALPGNHAEWDPALFQSAHRVIVTDEEARILDTLANDQLKGSLELFWKKRDPTPTTAANEF